MNSKFYLFLLILLLPIICYSSGSVLFDKDSVYNKVIAYTNSLTNYCCCKGNNWEQNKESVIGLFATPDNPDPVQEYHHEYDLFDSIIEDDCTIAGYLNAIHYLYNNDLKIAFSNIAVTDCNINDLVLVSAEKTIYFGKIKKVLPVIIDVDVSISPYSIRSVQLLTLNEIEECKVIKLSVNKKLLARSNEFRIKTKRNKISLSIEDSKIFNYYISLADDKFRNGFYSKAIRYYKKSLQYIANSPYSELMMSKCESIRSENSSIPYLSITYGFPPLLEGGKTYTANILITYDDFLKGQEAIHEIILPEGCSASIDPSCNLGFKFGIDNNKIVIEWSKLPYEIPFIISYRVRVSENIRNIIHGKLTGTFSYKDNGVMNIKYFDNKFY
jgi:hypothetical protein